MNSKRGVWSMLIGASAGAIVGGLIGCSPALISVKDAPAHQVCSAPTVELLPMPDEPARHLSDNASVPTVLTAAKVTINNLETTLREQQELIRKSGAHVAPLKAGE